MSAYWTQQAKAVADLERSGASNSVVRTVRHAVLAALAEVSEAR
jgi:hypothetical protein